jgi:DNA-binding NarL/FixJ family response regulator
MKRISVMIVDDEEIVRSGLKMVIQAEHDMFVLDTAVNGLSALDKIAIHKPDVLLIDIQMPVMDGLECIRQLREWAPEMPILILTTFNEIDYIIRGLALGAKGYLIKGVEMDRFAQHIRDVYHDRFVLPSQVAVKLSDHLLKKSEIWAVRGASEFAFPDKLFTKKEQEIILLLQTEITIKDISTRLHTSEGTMRNYITRIYRKLSVRNRQEALAAIQIYIIPCGSTSELTSGSLNQNVLPSPRTL